MPAGCPAGCDHASQAESGDQASPVTTPLSDAAISRTWPDSTSTTRSRPSCAATATVLPSGAAASPVTRPTWPAAIRRGAGGRIGLTCRIAGADLQPVAATSVGRPDDLSVGPQYLRETRPHARYDRHGPRGPIPVGQPVHGSANLDRAGPPAMVDGQRADVVLARDQARRPAARGRAERDVEPDRLGRLQIIEQPQLATTRVDDPLPVGAGLPRVPALVVGVPPQVATVQRAGVDVAGALVVGKEREPPADDHRAGELGRQVREHAPERARDPVSRARCTGNNRRRGADPQASGRATAVALPVGRIGAGAAPGAGEQPHRVRPPARRPPRLRPATGRIPGRTAAPAPRRGCPTGRSPARGPGRSAGTAGSPR